MIIDCHVHTIATAPGEGGLSRRMLHSPSFKALTWKVGVPSVTARPGPAADREMEDRLAATMPPTAAGMVTA